MLIESRKSSSLSPGKPTIISVVRPAWGIYFLIIFAFSMYSSRVYLLFIAFKILLDPDCRDKWKWSQSFPVFTALSINSWVIIIGSTEDNLILSMPSTSAILSIKSINLMSLKSMPKDPMWMPVKTISLKPRFARVLASLTESSIVLDLIGPLAKGIMQ